MMEQVSINNKLIFLSGDACISTYAYLGCVFANLKVADDYKLDVNFYDLVKTGKWTLEEFYRLSNMVGLDQENDGVYNPKTDTFGWANIQTGVRVMWSSCDMNLIVRENDGTFAVRETLDDRILNFMSTIKTMYESPRSSFFTAATTKDAITAFVQDRCLFASFYVYMSKDFISNGMVSPFAVLPLPMYDAAQGDYISTNISAYNALFFPITMSKPELSAKVAEYMGWFGQEKVVPAYYDESLKYKDNEVEENIEMLDLIRDKLRVTPNEVFGTIGDLIGLTATTDKNMENFYANPASTWKKERNNFADGVSNYIFQYFQ